MVHMQPHHHQPPGVCAHATTKHLSKDQDHTRLILSAKLLEVEELCALASGHINPGSITAQGLNTAREACALAFELLQDLEAFTTSSAKPPRNPNAGKY